MALPPMARPAGRAERRDVEDEHRDRVDAFDANRVPVRLPHLAIGGRVIQTPPCIFYVENRLLNIQGGIRMTLTSRAIPHLRGQLVGVQEACRLLRVEPDL